MNISIGESMRVGQEVARVSASDEDGHLITYEIVGEVPAPYYFRVDPTTGRIMLDNLLTQSTDISYTVSVV